MNEHLSLSSTVVLTPRRAGLAAGQDNVVDVLVRIQAPDAPAGHTAARPAQGTDDARSPRATARARSELGDATEKRTPPIRSRRAQRRAASGAPGGPRRPDRGP